MLYLDRTLADHAAAVNTRITGRILAIQLDAVARSEGAMRSVIEKRLQTLSRRERQVMELVIRGQINKQIGVALDISEKTVKVHRGHVLSKMHVRSVANLVQLVARVGVEITFPDIDAAASNDAEVPIGRSKGAVAP